MNIIGTIVRTRDTDSRYIISAPLENERGEFVLVSEKDGRIPNNYTQADYDYFIKRGWWIPEQVDLQPLIHS